jgi:hypothetical protein
LRGDAEDGSSGFDQAGKHIYRVTRRSAERTVEEAVRRMSNRRWTA